MFDLFGPNYSTVKNLLKILILKETLLEIFNNIDMINRYLVYLQKNMVYLVINCCQILFFYQEIKRENLFYQIIYMKL